MAPHVRRFGTPGARPKAYIQAGLHADEVPPMLVAHHLCARLQRLHDAGQVRGEVAVVPAANPHGLGQRLLGAGIGRFDLRDGVNFNRGIPALADAAADQVARVLGSDPAANVAVIRAALLTAAAGWRGSCPSAALKQALLHLAADADYVWDLHCENEGVVHLYALTPLAEACAPLSAALGARALLLADESGGDPFDEACSRPWLLLQHRFPGHPIPLACCAVTVELRGEADVDHRLAEQDAAALVSALAAAGIVDGAPPMATPCAPTPLAAVEPVVASCAGIVTYHVPVGAAVQAGDAVATVTNPVSGAATLLHARSAGVLFARESARFVAAGRAVAKVAGTDGSRTGPLLGA